MLYPSFALWTVVYAQVEVPEASLHYRRIWSQIAVLEDYIYIEGGELSQYLDDDSDDVVESPVNVTLSLPLNESWSNDALAFTEIDKGDKPPVKGFNLWVDHTNNQIYQWDGAAPFETGEGADNPQLWIFTPDGNGSGEWETVSPGNGVEFRDLLRPAGGAGATCGDEAYLLGGYANQYTDDRANADDHKVPVPGMVSLNMTTREWNNESMISVVPPHGTYMDGRATCVDGQLFHQGEEGDEHETASHYLFMIGGMKVAPDGVHHGTVEVGMSNITFYDQKAGLWRWQQASGEIPPERIRHCLVGVPSPRGTFVYGGVNKLQGALSDFWVLSLPGFQWFKLEGDHPRRTPSACSVVGRSQLLFVGDSLDQDEVDPWPYSIGLFDLNRREWSFEYSADADDYEPPDFVTEWYNNGGLDEVVWSGEEVKNIFASSRSSLPTPSDSDSGVSSDTGSKSPSPFTTGTIAGGAVGGVVLLALAGGLLFWLVRRRKAEKSEVAAADVPKSAEFPNDHTKAELVADVPAELPGYPYYPGVLGDASNDRRDRS